MKNPDLLAYGTDLLLDTPKETRQLYRILFAFADDDGKCDNAPFNPRDVLEISVEQIRECYRLLAVRGLLFIRNGQGYQLTDPRVNTVKHPARTAVDVAAEEIACDLVEAAPTGEPVVISELIRNSPRTEWMFARLMVDALVDDGYLVRVTDPDTGHDRYRAAG